MRGVISEQPSAACVLRATSLHVAVMPLNTLLWTTPHSSHFHWAVEGIRSAFFSLANELSNNIFTSWLRILPRLFVPSYSHSSF